MNSLDAFDRLVADVLQEGPLSAPDGPVVAALEHAARHPRRETSLRLFRLGQWLAPRGSVIGLGPVPATLVVIGLAVALALAVAVVGGVLQNRLSSPGPSAPPASTTRMPNHPPSATPPPVPSLLPDGRLPGDAMPEDWLGVWRDVSSGGWVVNRRRGDAFCVEIVSTEQDCDAFLDPDGTLIGFGRVSSYEGYVLYELDFWKFVSRCSTEPRIITAVMQGSIMTWEGDPESGPLCGGSMLQRLDASPVRTAPPWPPASPGPSSA